MSVWDVVGLFTVFDWITPAVQIGQNLLGGMTTIDVTVDGWTGAEVQRALEQAGVKCGLGMIVNGVVLLPVDNAERAELVLARLRGELVAPSTWAAWPSSTAPTVRRPGPRRLRGRSRLWDLLEE